MPTFTGTANGETLIGTAGQDSLLGLGGDDSLHGLADADLLDGGDGRDTMIGGTGNDRYLVGDPLDIIVELTGEGDDTLYANVDYALAAGVSVETMTTMYAAGTAALALTGNEIGNSIYGNAGHNVLNGGGGIDHLVGLEGNDVYVVDQAADRISETPGNGDDWLISAGNYALDAGVSIETLSTANELSLTALELSGNDFGQSIYGNSGDNVLRGNGGNDYLVGMAGADHIYGGTGDDWIVSGAGNDTIETGEGSDTIVFASVGDANTDFVTDWNSQDRIDLSGIDANSLVEGNQAFEFAGYAFGHPPTNTAAGTVTIGGFGGSLWIIGHVDGDGIADFMIDLWSEAGEAALTSANLIF